MSTLEKNKQVNFKTNAELYQQASAVFSEKNLDATSAFNYFLQFVATNKVLPFLDKDEAERELLISNLQQRLKENLNTASLSLDEMEQRLADL
ncbi:hypothetical protein ACFO26_09630 [Lactococcus nasutitermitis]|uniref:Uncharacterized protein n=1 Tax=Lactococcus nasutitermitis TaxID=1652957 RepID=A0ABV9JEM8_9LACT|nr:hypothetical protein [Lactococcus nasutitermitis]